LIKALAKMIPLIVYMLSHLSCRKRNRWVFGSRSNTFSDNSKYLFLYLSHHGDDDLNIAWITGNKKLVDELRGNGLNAYARWSIKGIIFALTSKVFVFSFYANDINFWLSGRAKHINLWHGVGIKNIEFGIKNGPLQNKYKESFFNLWRLISPQIFRRPDLLLSTSEAMTKHFSKCFRIDEDKCVQAGYPRVEGNLVGNGDCISYSGDLECDSFIEHGSADKRFVLYMPTWRDSSDDFLESSGFDFKCLDSFNKANDIVFFVKLHPNTKCIIGDEYETIKVVDNGVDVYPFLKKFDVLVTDYSSIYYDFMVTGKPTIFYIFDHDDYAANSREFVMPFRDSICGVECHNFKELLLALEKQTYLSVDFEKYNYVRNYFWGEGNEGSCQKIIDAIKNI